MCGFPSVELAILTSVMILQMGIPIGRLEFLDEASIHAVNRYSKLDYPVCPTLFFEFSGSSQSVQEQVEIVGKTGSALYIYISNFNF